MRKNILTKVIAGILTVCLMLGNLVPVTALATETETTDLPSVDTTTEETSATEETSTTEETIPTEPVAPIADAEELYVDSYAVFVEELKVLEGYAASYAATSGKNSGELILNFLRTGVDRYNDGNWKTLAGEEITGFTSYVAAQDAANQTTVMRLRNIELFTLPNGQQVDFGHMFGTMNIAYISAQASADLGGWAGDICDLMLYSKDYGNVPAGTIEEMAQYIRLNCFGVNADDAFGMDDFYGDMDAFYLIAQMKAGKTLSTVMEAYFTASLTDRVRAEYFLKNRFEDLYTQESVREAVYNAYTSNVGLQVLESGRGLAGETDLRMASCYGFADYLYGLAGDTLEEPVEDPTEPSEPEEEPSEPTEPEEEPDNPYYSVFSSTSSVLAPGITQTIRYALTADNKQIVYYLATVDVTRDDVTIMANYHDADPSKGWAMQRVTDQVEALTAKHTNPEDPDNYIENFRAIVSTNGAGFNMSTGEPGGLLVMGGVEWHPVNGDGFFAILKDGSAMIGTTAEYGIYKDQIQEAIAGFGSVLIKDGEIVAKNDGGRASRTAIGIMANGAVVMMVLDGRQEPFSAGGSMAEIAQIMLDAGCVHAINLDGGGSTTFAAKPEGSDSIVVVNRPSDGFQRSVSTSLVAVSTAITSKEFSYANISTEYDYLTVGTSLELEAVGVSESGSSADVPENAVWQVSDSSIGSITDGVFTAAALGEVEVQLLVDGEVVGRKTLHVVIPDTLKFKDAFINVVYNTMTELPLIATYEGNEVAFNARDVYVGLQYSNAGKTQGTSILIYEASGYRTLIAGAQCLSNPNAYALITVNAYRSDETMFDFENATSGDERFAWVREVSNSEKQDNNVYQILDTKKEMEVSYVFALDMQAIEIPEKLRDLTSMLPGGDDQSTTAWQYLLRLAERVSTLTTVTIVAQFDPNLQVDCSEMTVSNDFFEFSGVTVDDETNTVTIKATWIDRTAAVDPSTANPICILSGIKVTPKSDAEWDSEDRLAIVNVGEVGYKVYLRASSLYSFAKIESNQQTYNLYPFSRVLENGTTESGAYFEDAYATFEDTFTLDKTNRQGWYSVENYLYYYKDNKVLTGIQVVPGHEDPDNYYVYNFGVDGASQGMVTGLFEIDGELYYALNGVRKTGWQALPNTSGTMSYYYFAPNSYSAVDGEQTIDGYTYKFEDKILVRGQLVKDSKGTRYRWAGTWSTQEWINVDGNISYTQMNGYFATGIKWMYAPDGVKRYFVLTDDGIWLKDLSGIYEWNGGTYLVEEGYAIDYPGLFEMDGDYYYISSTNVMVKNRNYWISKTNGIVPEGSYWFDADGKMTLPPETDPDEDGNLPELKNGIVEEKGGLYYYVDGRPNYAGLIRYTGDLTNADGTVTEDVYSDSLIYVRGTGELVVGRSYWVTKNNGLMSSANYEFDDKGRMIVDDTENPAPDDGGDTPGEGGGETPDPETPAPAVKNGIVAENGSLFYYVDGKLNYAGLTRYTGGLTNQDGTVTEGVYDNVYIYVRGTGELVAGRSYWITKNNGLMKSATFQFDDQGRMILEDDVPENPETPETPETPDPVVKNGIVEENGALYYYVDGKLNYAGLTRYTGGLTNDDGTVTEGVYDNAFIYVRGTGELVVGRSYWITKHNGLMASATFEFDDKGRMIVEEEPEAPTDPETPEPEVKKGIVAENGSLFYYVDGKLNYAGLIKIDGYFYYVRGNGELVHDCEYWPTKTNGWFTTTRRYTFDSQGRMVDPPV